MSPRQEHEVVGKFVVYEAPESAPCYVNTVVNLISGGFKPKFIYQNYHRYGSPCTRLCSHLDASPYELVLVADGAEVFRNGSTYQRLELWIVPRCLTAPIASRPYRSFDEIILHAVNVAGDLQESLISTRST